MVENDGEVLVNCMVNGGVLCGVFGGRKTRHFFGFILGVIWNRARQLSTSLHLSDVAGFPTLVDGGLGRAAEPKDSENPLPGTVEKPVAGSHICESRLVVFSPSSHQPELVNNRE